MIKQLIIDGKKSYDDFSIYISSRTISLPKKKTIKETLPFSNIVYDFSKINGEIYWEERTLEYSFDIAEFTTEKMEEEKTKLSNWFLNVHDTDIYDPYIGNFHYHGSFNEGSWSEDFGAGTINVSFSVYPYKIANASTNMTLSNGEYTNYELSVNNNSSHRIKPIITSTGNFTVQFNNSTYSIGIGTYSDSFYLQEGVNELEISGNGSLVFAYKEEVF